MFRFLYFLLLFSACDSHVFIHPLSKLGVTETIRDIDPNIKVQADPTVLQSSGSWVTVTWKGVASPSGDDWIGVYEPASADPNASAPVKYQFANICSSHMTNGSGTVRFRLVNTRVDIAFKFLRNGTKFPILAAVSNVVTFKNPNEPTQVHLALTDSSSSMSVSWVSGMVSEPLVIWGTTPGHHPSVARASYRTYNVSHMCGAPASTVGWHEPGWLIQANMIQLKSGVKYYYKVGDKKYGWSLEFSFVAAPTPDGTQRTRLIAFGDMGNGQVDGSIQHWEEQPSLNTTANILSELDDTDLILHIGDISYAVGYAAEWDEFFDQIQPIASKIPYMVCMGNHELDFPVPSSLFSGQDSGGECGIPYVYRFAMPRPSLNEPWYGFSYGNIHFVLMSTEHEFRKGSPQYNFLVNELASVDRKTTPWLIFAGHRPMYIDSTDNGMPAGENPVAELLKDELESLLKEYSVDLALWAHHHSYQRTCPVYQKKCTPNALTHVVIGMGGQTLEVDRKPVTPKYFVKLEDKHHGYSKIEANATHLDFWYIMNDVKEPFDHFVLSK